MNLENKKIVFFGDSITDTNKLKFEEYPYGMGYVNMFRAEVRELYDNPPIVYNEGVGGDKTENLIARLSTALSHNPDIVVLFIGINDVWHPYEAGVMPNNKEILKRLDYLCQEITKKSRLIVILPFLFPIDDFFNSLYPYYESFKKEEIEYLKSKNYEYIDMHNEIDKYVGVNGKRSVTKDSVHPTLLGHGIIAQTILEYLKNN